MNSFSLEMDGVDAYTSSISCKLMVISCGFEMVEPAPYLPLCTRPVIGASTK